MRTDTSMGRVEHQYQEIPACFRSAPYLPYWPPSSQSQLRRRWQRPARNHPRRSTVRRRYRVRSGGRIEETPRRWTEFLIVLVPTSAWSSILLQWRRHLYDHRLAALAVSHG